MSTQKINYAAIGIAVVALIAAVAAAALAMQKPTTTAGKVTVAFTPSGNTINMSAWNWAPAGKLYVSGGDALVKFKMDGVVAGSGKVRLVNVNTGDAIEGDVGEWIAVKAGTYNVYIRALLTTTDTSLSVEAYA